MSVKIEFHNLPGTSSTVAWSNHASVTVDRAAGHFGGLGIGFSGTECLAVALGGALADSLQVAAHRRGVKITGLWIGVELETADSVIPTRGTIHFRFKSDVASDNLDEVEAEASQAFVLAAILSRGGLAIETVRLPG